MTRRSRIFRLAVACALVLVLAPGLVACGKRSSPRPPEGEESKYTYPNFYPKPGSTGVPLFGGGAASKKSEKPATRGDLQDEEGLAEPVVEAPALSPFPSERSTFGTYGTSSE